MKAASSTKHRIAVITTSFPRFEGDEATLFLGRLIDALSEAGHAGHIIVPFDNDEPQEDTRGGFSIHRVKYGLFTKGRLAFGNGILPNLRKNPLLLLQAPLLLLQLFRKALPFQDSFDVIHGHWIVTAIPAYFLSLLSKKPFMLTVRGEDIKLLRTPLRFVFGFFLKRAAHISTVSNEFERELSEVLPSLKEKISLTPNGITRFEITEAQKRALLERLEISSEKIILSYVGRLVPLKQPELLIRAIHLIRKEQPETMLVLAGRVTEELRQQLLAKASELEVYDRVAIPGSLSPSEVGTLLSVSKLYLSASTHEGRSNAVLEALAAGVPPCLSDIPGHQELVKHNKNGRLFEVTSADDAARSIQKMLASPNLWASLSSEARHSVSHLTWAECGKSYANKFSDILESNLG